MTMTPDEIRKDLENRKSKEKGGGKDKWISIKEGTRDLYRIAPPWKKGGEFWKDVFFHGGFNDKVYCRKNEINPKTNKPRKCVVCQRQLDLHNDRSPRSKKLWALIHQKSESLWNMARVVKKRTDSEGRTIARKYEDNKFKVLRLSSKWRDMLMELFGDEDYRDSAKSVLGLTHSKRGRLIKIKRTGKGRDDTSYSFIPEGFATPILMSKERRLKMLATVNDLDAMVSGSSEEELAAFLEKKEKEARRLAKEEAKKPDDVEDDDAEDVDDDDEEENESKKKSKSDDEDDEEEETEKEEEDSDEDDDDKSDVEKKYDKVKKKVKRDEEVDDEDEEGEDDED